MARPLRIEYPGGRYHVTARGNEHRVIYRKESDRFRFLQLLGETSERFGVRVHAYVLMNNHFHLLLETPEANLSRAMQWLGVSYSVWFNRHHRRAGHLFQGRFKSVVVEDDAGWQELGRYLHLNPVRVGALGLHKRQRAASRNGLVSRPAAEQVSKRLRLLREYRWSSYRGYAGYCAHLNWLRQEPLARLCGGKSEAERRASLREYTEQAVRQGVAEPPWNRLVAGSVLGTAAFASRLRKSVKGNSREQTALKRLSQRPSWKRIVKTVEAVKGERWADFSARHGDWGRDAALWLGRREGRMKLGELAHLVGGMDYAAAGQAISRFGQRVDKDAHLQRQVHRIQTKLSNVEI